MTNEKVNLSRPKDESLEAFKDWIQELTNRLTGKTGDDGSMTDEAWEEQWKRFWKDKS
ncbi:MAG: hypothetical protein ABI621_11220 [Chloroflexota bacterium]